MKTKIGAIIAVLCCTLLLATAQIFYKFGAAKLTYTLSGILTNYWIFIGIGMYAIGAGVLIISLRHGELSVLYPLVALGYVWVNFASAYFFHEPLTTLKWVGIGIIILGMCFIGIGSHAAEKKEAAA